MGYRTSVSLGLLLCLGGPLAEAQDACVPRSPEPGVLQLTPPAGAPQGVTLDSPLVARYAASVDTSSFAAARLLRLSSIDAEGFELPVDGRYERFAAQPSVVVFWPEGELAPDASYLARAYDPAEGTERELRFRTSERLDEVPPRFAAGADLDVRSSSQGSSCASLRVDVTFTPAVDDGPAGSVEHLVFQSRGNGLEAPVLRARVRASMSTEVSASFLLDEREAASPLCVQVVAVDGTGRVSDPLGPTCHAPPRTPRFVSGCGAASGGAPADPFYALWVIAFSFLWRTLRRDERA